MRYVLTLVSVFAFCFSVGDSNTLFFLLFLERLIAPFLTPFFVSQEKPFFFFASWGKRVHRLMRPFSFFFLFEGINVRPFLRCRKIDFFFFFFFSSPL